MSKHRDRVVPALRPGLLAERVGQECVVFDTETNDAHCLAPLAAAVFAHCDGRAKVDDLPVLVSLTLGEAVSLADVELALGQLDEVGLLAPSADAAANLTRRRFIQASAATVGAAALVTTMATPAAAQVSVRTCGTGLRCVSQDKGDDFCNCTNVCAGSSTTIEECEKHGMGDILSFDSCECFACPNPEKEDWRETEFANSISGDNPPYPTYAPFLQYCPRVGITQPVAFDPNFDPDLATFDMGDTGGTGTPCDEFGVSGVPLNWSNGGCVDGTKLMDGICVPRGGDSTEQCL